MRDTRFNLESRVLTLRLDYTFGVLSDRCIRGTQNMVDMEKAIEAAARALCRAEGNPENIKFEGKPMWQSHVPAAKAALEAALPHLRDD